MKLTFETNDYLLTWNLLYGASISPKIHATKQKLWSAYKKQYNAGMKDKDEMLQDIKNYIPDDDTLYNLIFETDVFEILKKSAEKHRLTLMKVWDEKKKEVNQYLKEILRFPLADNYNILVLCPEMDSVLISKTTKTSIGWGFKKDTEDQYMALSNILYTLIKNEVGDFEKEYKEIVQAILELAIHNELYTRLVNNSNYLEGDHTLMYLKRQIYPYWLMYLGCDREDMTHYMMRDKIAFDIDNYTMETALKKVDLYEFIRFCIKNQKHIIRINNLEII